MATIELLEWDSRFFGRRIARLYSQPLSAADLKNALARCWEQRIDCLVCLVDASEIEARLELENAGFHLQDIRITLQHDQPGMISAPGRGSIRVREATPDDLPELEAIAARSYRLTRFYNDPQFGAEQASELYRTWIRNSVNGYANLVLIAELQGKPAGYIACHLEAGQTAGRIGLVAVADNAQGAGLGTILVNQALQWFQQKMASPVLVVTQGANRGALRLYQRAGFTIHSVSLWYHRWFKYPSEEAALEQLSDPI